MIALASTVAVLQAQAVGVGPFNGGPAESSSDGLITGESQLILPNLCLTAVFDSCSLSLWKSSR